MERKAPLGALMALALVVLEAALALLALLLLAADHYWLEHS